MEIIDINYGGGGKLTDRLIREVILRYLPYQSELMDAALLKLEGTLAFTTDSYVVSPIFFPGGDIGKLAVCGTCNDLAMVGAEPFAISLAFIIEEGFGLDEFKVILSSIAEEVSRANIAVVTGDTKVVPRGKADGIYINTSGVGRQIPSADLRIERIKPSDLVIISGSIGEHSIAVMSKREDLGFKTEVLSDVANLAPLANGLLREFGTSVKFMRDPTRGGLAGVLVDIAEGGGFEIEIWEDKIPLRPEVRAAVDILGLDILSCANEGKFVVVVSREVVDDIITFLKGFDLTSNATVIGEVKDKRSGRAVLRTRIGGSRIIQKPYGDQLPRIC